MLKADVKNGVPTEKRSSKSLERKLLKANSQLKETKEMLKMTQLSYESKIVKVENEKDQMVEKISYLETMLRESNNKLTNMQIQLQI